MKNLRLAPLAAVAAGLLAATWASPAAAETPCESLERAMFAWGWLGQKTENPMKPVNLQTEAVAAKYLKLYWDAPSTRPAGTVSGRCVHLRHVETGGEAEFCRAGMDINIGTWSCLGAAGHQSNCPLGAYGIKVKMQNNCGLREDYSDAIAATRDEISMGHVWRSN